MGVLGPKRKISRVSLQPKLVSQAGIPRQSIQRLHEFSTIVVNNPASALLNYFWQCTQIVDDHGSPHGKGFDDHNPERFVADGRNESCNSTAVQLGQPLLIQLAEKRDVRSPFRQSPQRVLVFPATNNKQIVFTTFFKYRDQVLNSLNLFHAPDKQKIWSVTVSLFFPGTRGNRFGPLRKKVRYVDNGNAQSKVDLLLQSEAAW